MKRGSTGEVVEARDLGDGDTMSSWLAGFERMLPGTAREKRETRAELESHLRDRSRDLMLAGLDADEAARRAIGELGEATEIAASYRATRVETQRRQAMQVAGIGLAAGAVVVSVAALFQGASARQTAQPEMLRLVTPTVVVGEGGVAPASGEKAVATRTGQTLRVVEVAGVEDPVKAKPVELEQYHEPVPDSEAFAKARVTAKLHQVELGTALQAIAEMSKGKIVAQLDALEAGDATVTAEWDGVPLIEVLKQVNVGLAEANRIGVRERDGVLVIAPERVFDAAETSLVAYRVSGVLQKAYGCVSDDGKRAELLEQTLAGMVYRDDWVDHGGTAAEMHYAGGILFVKAPERHHHMVAWILKKLETE